MPYSLKGCNVLVTGGGRGLGALICEKFAAEGCNIAINYVSSKKVADELAKKIKIQHAVKTVVLQADVGFAVDSDRLVANIIEGLGGLDIIVSNAGWTKFAPWEDLYALSEADWDKCYAVNVKAQLHLLRAALATFKANENGGTFLITSSAAGTTTKGSSMAYSVSKAAGIHLTRCLAETQGPNVRVNAVCPGLMLTEWGEKYAALKKITNMEDCADTFIWLAKNGSITGQRLIVGKFADTLLL
ncbi:NAD(P)-binding protein [Cadophora sp. DSE1049]|nr:NAD(P)-binding protein [Cadophora sp. DSE1049]